MTDHQQAAIEAIEGALVDLFNDRLGPDESVYVPSDVHGDGAVLLAAAEPHLRKKWAEEVLNEGIIGAGYSVLMNPNRREHPVTTFTRAVKHMLALLEGAGE